MNNHASTHLDLFSGIGGFALAFEREGFRTIGHAEVDPFACEVYHRHFPRSVCFGRVQNVTRNSVLERCGVLPTVVTGGFPCQPHSTAGKRLASADERDLWGECKRVVGDLRPRFAVFENVGGLLTSESGLFLNRVLSDVAEIRFAALWQIVSAADVEAPHRRERIWLVLVNEMANGESERKSSKPGSSRKRILQPFGNRGAVMADDVSQRVQELGRQIAAKSQYPPPLEQPSCWPTICHTEARQGFQNRSNGMKGSQKSLTTIVAESGQQQPACGQADQGNLSLSGNHRELWPTASVCGNHNQKGASPTSGDGLATVVLASARPTPRAREVENGKTIQGGLGLTSEVQRQWATAGASVSGASKKGKWTGRYMIKPNGKKAQTRLSDQIANEDWPTTSSNNGTGGCTGLAGGSGNRKKLYRTMGQEQGRAMGCQRLNPHWVACLMGYPPPIRAELGQKFTTASASSKATATPSSRNADKSLRGQS